MLTGLRDKSFCPSVLRLTDPRTLIQRTFELFSLFYASSATRLTLLFFFSSPNPLQVLFAYIHAVSLWIQYQETVGILIAQQDSMVVLPTPSRLSIKLCMYMVSTGIREKYNGFNTTAKRRRKLLIVKKKRRQANGTGIIHIPIYTQHVHCFRQMPTSRLLDPLLAAESVHSSCFIPPGQGGKLIHRAP